MPKEISKVGKYEIKERIARGGMGAVYLAKHPTLKRYVILKRLTFKGGREIVERFKREASLMMDFRNEHIVQVYDHFKEGNSYYIVMEYVDGTSLEDLIENLIKERGKLNPNIAALIFREICIGVKYAHDKGVIHRDIKPANILISKEGQVKIVDFGIATSDKVDKSEDETLTRTGIVMGTPSYMSPEQITDSSKVTKESDIYSLGVVFYEMLTGIKPFPSTYDGNTIARISKGKYKNPKKLNPQIPFFCKRIIKKMMNPKANNRFHDLKSVIDKISGKLNIPKEQNIVNEKIKNYLNGIEPELKINSGLKSFILSFKTAIIILAILSISLGSLYVFTNGYQHELFQSKKYGLLNITALLPKHYYKTPDSVFAYCKIFKIGKTKNKEKALYNIPLTASNRQIIYRIKKFFNNKTKKSYESQVLRAKKLYIPSGKYKLELFVDNQKLFSSFTLYPRKIQKRNNALKNGRNIRFYVEKLPPRTITIKQNIFDQNSGKSIYGITDIRFYLSGKNKWIDWKRYMSNTKLRKILLSGLTTGKTYYFKYSAPNYITKTIRLYANSYVDNIKVNVFLEKAKSR